MVTFGELLAVKEKERTSCNLKKFYMLIWVVVRRVFIYTKIQISACYCIWIFPHQKDHVYKLSEELQLDSNKQFYREEPKPHR